MSTKKRQCGITLKIFKAWLGKIIHIIKLFAAPFPCFNEKKKITFQQFYFLLYSYHFRYKQLYLLHWDYLKITEKNYIKKNKKN